MKKINILILCSILCFFYSCNGMLDGIQPYLDEGEKIYVGKLDSLKAFTGKNRMCRLLKVRMKRHFWQKLYSVRQEEPAYSV